MYKETKRLIRMLFDLIFGLVISIGGIIVTTKLLIDFVTDNPITTNQLVVTFGMVILAEICDIGYAIKYPKIPED